MILEVCDVSPRVHDSLGQTETLMTVNEAKEIRRYYSVFLFFLATSLGTKRKFKKKTFLQVLSEVVKPNAALRLSD